MVRYKTLIQGQEISVSDEIGAEQQLMALFEYMRRTIVGTVEREQPYKGELYLDYGSVRFLAAELILYRPPTVEDAIKREEEASAAKVGEAAS